MTGGDGARPGAGATPAGAGAPGAPGIVGSDGEIAQALAEPVVLVEHDPAWSGAAETERARLLARFGDRLHEVAHIGSTAVPGLLAKPVVDLLAGVATIDDVHALVAPLRGFGYHFDAAGNAGFDDRQWLLRQRGGRRTHHLHLVVHGSAAWRDRVAFRDRLRADPALRDRYADLKRGLLARAAGDRAAYTDGKRPFVLEALGRPDAGSGTHRTA